MTFRILVGLPSFNEADTIAAVATDIDTALQAQSFRYGAELVNVDNSSTDGTSAAFSTAPTRCSKRTITTPPASGKGGNWQTILRLAQDEGVDAVLFADTDLAEVPASWIDALLRCVHSGADVCYPLRPPTWNGGDLTYHLAYPMLASTYGVDLREPLSGEVALSSTAMDRLLQETWLVSERRFGVDFLLATVAATQRWTTAALRTPRRNKLRSFARDPGGEYRMGAKFADVAATVQHRSALRLRRPPPERFTPSPSHTPLCTEHPVPPQDPDIAALAESTGHRLQRDARSRAFAVFSAPLAKRLYEHASSETVTHGLSWADWRDCLYAWILDHDASPDRAIPVELLETLFLNRVVGHHREIAGTANWYATVREQARDAFAHRHALWASQ